MKIVADENIDSQLVELLRSEGHHVLWIAESAPSINDQEVLQRAFEEHSLLITEIKE